MGEICKRAYRLDTKLAPELWQKICLLLSDPEAAGLAKCSTYLDLYQVAHPRIFRGITLHYKEGNTFTVRNGRTMNFLAKLPDVTRHVREFHPNIKPGTPLPILNFHAALRNMTNLKLFEGCGSLFANKEDQVQFVKTLQERDKPLEELTWLLRPHFCTRISKSRG
jgi:hypothetical protein